MRQALITELISRNISPINSGANSKVTRERNQDLKNLQNSMPTLF